MKTFEYSAVDRTGESVTGRTIAENELQVDKELEGRGLILVSAKPIHRGRKLHSAKMTTDEVVSFTNQLATVLSAGVPIVNGIDDLAPRMRTEAGRHVLSEITADLKAGHTLGESMDHQARSFPEMYRASVRAGELSGDMPGILRRLSAYLDWARAMRATTIQALVYPTILLCAVIGLIVVLLTFLLPRIMTLFPGGREDLPFETQVVLSVSDFLTGNVIFLCAGALLMGFGFWAIRQKREGRIYLSRMLLRVPRLGEVVRMLATSKFAATASTLHKSGCDIHSVIQGAGESCGNAYFASCFEAAGEDIKKGKTITESLEQSPDMDPLLIQITNVGEKSGDLGGSLERLSEYYDNEVPRTVKWFLSLLEPGILIVSGVFVAFILMAALMPIFSLYDNLS